ncbi:MAG: DUF4406 domain-containing protein [Bacteroidota bacterium]
MKEPLMILVAGPYRSGTNDIPELIEKNIQAMNDMAWEVYQLGHLPVLGEWFALPLIETAGSKEMGDEVWNELFHPVAIRLIEKCEVIFRIGGPSTGADKMVQIGKERGKRIVYGLEEI